MCNVSIPLGIESPGHFWRPLCLGEEQDLKQICSRGWVFSESRKRVQRLCLAHCLHIPRVLRSVLHILPASSAKLCKVHPYRTPFKPACPPLILQSVLTDFKYLKGYRDMEGKL